MAKVVQEPLNGFGIGRNYHTNQYSGVDGSFFDVVVRYSASGDVILEHNILSNNGFITEQVEY
jgi:hypothetical protein